MRSIDYADFADHRKQHVAFVRRVLGFVRSHREGDSHLLGELAAFLDGWIVRHIAESDAGYATARTSAA